MKSTAATAGMEPMILGLLRIFAGLLFIQHGTRDFFGFPFAPGGEQIVLQSWTGLWKASETVGALLIILGLWTRPVAFLMMIDMVLVYALKFMPASPFPVINHGESAILFAAVFGYFAVAGPGLWNLDAVLTRRRRA